VMLEIVREVDRCHPAATDLALDRVVAGKGGLQGDQLLAYADPRKAWETPIIGAGIEQDQRGRVEGRKPPSRTPPIPERALPASPCGSALRASDIGRWGGHRRAILSHCVSRQGSFHHP
jgi:hypothetical protein